MGLKAAIKNVIELSGYTVHKKNVTKVPDNDADNDASLNSIYDQDGLRSIHNHDFMDDLDFCKAYGRGELAVGKDYEWHWRAHVGLWVAFSASKLKGDFVECGVNYGCLSSSIMEYLDWDKLGKTFYLLDTFSGLDEKNDIKGIMKAEARKAEARKFYVIGVDSVRENFSQWRNINIIVGTVPDTLDDIDAKEIAYLHLDMNCAPPEVAAFEYLWNRLVPGAFVLLDDYAYDGYEPQKHAMDKAAAAKGLKILSIPTGQGLLTKPV